MIYVSLGSFKEPLAYVYYYYYNNTLGINWNKDALTNKMTYKQTL
jgi:hypothetical protein